MIRVALITGAAGGIGAATARHFSAAGWRVFAVDRRPAEKLADNVVGVTADVSRESDVAAVIERVGEESGRLDSLVNNAAVQIGKPLTAMSVEEWDETLASNLRSAFLMSRAAHPLLQASRGSVVNVASVHAIATSTNIAAYAASKGGLVALTRALAVEFGPDGVRVNAVLPGAIDTPMLREGFGRAGYPEESARRLVERTPLGRIGAAEDVARAILFLADGEQSPFTTGQCLIVDGGATARLSTE